MTLDQQDVRGVLDVAGIGQAAQDRARFLMVSFAGVHQGEVGGCVDEDSALSEMPAGPHARFVAYASARYLCLLRATSPGPSEVAIPTMFQRESSLVTMPVFRCLRGALGTGLRIAISSPSRLSTHGSPVSLTLSATVRSSAMWATSRDFNAFSISFTVC
jgi:hypothetical protein